MTELYSLDRIDSALVALLRNNARLSNKELAAHLSIAPSTCWERVKRLIDSGVIKGFHAEVEPKAKGIHLQAMIAVRLRQHSKTMVESFRNHAISIPEVIACYHVAGSEDFLVHVGVRDADHLRDLTMTSFTTRSEVDHIQTSLVFEYIKPENTKISKHS